MAVNRRYDQQVTMMTTGEQKKWIVARSLEAKEAGGSRSEAQVCRDLFGYGQRIEEHARKTGWTPEAILEAVEAQIKPN